MKKIIIETFLKGIVFSLGMIFTIIGVYAVNNLMSIKSVDTQTVLTSNLWNETMSSLTGTINSLSDEVVKLTGDQTISGKKTFSTTVAGATPVGDTDLATKAYVDSKVGAAGAESWVTINLICGLGSESNGGLCTPPLCPTGWTEIYLSSKYLTSRDTVTNYNFYSTFRTCGKKM